MFNDSNLYISQFQAIINGGLAQISDIKPSAWTEDNVVMGKPRPGPFRYDYTPYAKEIIDCLAPDHPARKVAVMKGAQIGFSSGVIYPGIGWMIQNNPGNTYLMVGAPDLIPKAMEKLDLMIDGAGLRSYIKPQVQRNRANKSGDTNLKKDFSGGYVSIGSANNHKAIAQVDLQYIFLDDLDAMKGESAVSGDLIKLIEKRAAAYKDIYKMFMISTPLLKHKSLIEPAFLAGDQRYRMVECPCCHEPIVWKWKVQIDEKNAGGMVWEVDNHNRVIEKSVGYVCQLCAGFHTDKNKMAQLNGGFWKPTAIPSTPDYYSYHISSLYAPIGMFDWLKCARDYEEANPRGGAPRKEKEHQVFLNTVLGETYEPESKSPQASQIQKNQRDYKIGAIPEALSKRDGNGRIVLVTFGADCNGTVKGINGALEHDARIDYEIVAHAESGATYSIKHGSIGTFVPRERSQAEKSDRIKWTYEPGKPNSVWPVLDGILQEIYLGDLGGKYKINMPGIDVGAYTDIVTAFIDWTIGRYPTNPVVGLRGNKEAEFVLDNRNIPLFEVGKVRADVYFLQVGLIKDMLSNYMSLGWDKNNDTSQPANFMNYPMSQLYACPVKAKYYKAMGVAYEGDYLYQADSFFAHYESEHRTIVKKPTGGEASRWEKKMSTSQNHFFDCRVYNLADKEIIVKKIGKAIAKTSGIPPGEFSWPDYVNYINS